MKKEMIEDLNTLKDFFIEHSGSAFPVCLDYAIRSLESWDEIIDYLESTAKELLNREDKNQHHAFAKGIIFSVSMIKNFLKGVEEE